MNQKEVPNQEQEDHEELTEVIEEKGKKTNSDTDKVIADLTGKVADLKDKLLRQMAESENVRVRSAKAIDEAREYANFGFAKDLVPVMDNLTRALEHLPEKLGEDMRNIVEGINMTKKEFESVFRKHALEPIHPNPGDKFDYHTHHAISQIVTDEHEAGSVVSTMQTGYRIRDRLIRPAAVVVAKK
jgi:molecular chaperone GrpE